MSDAQAAQKSGHPRIIQSVGSRSPMRKGYLSRRRIAVDSSNQMNLRKYEALRRPLSIGWRGVEFKRLNAGVSKSVLRLSQEARLRGEHSKNNSSDFRLN